VQLAPEHSVRIEKSEKTCTEYANDFSEFGSYSGSINQRQETAATSSYAVRGSLIFRVGGGRIQFNTGLISRSLVSLENTTAAPPVYVARKPSQFIKVGGSRSKSFRFL